jgi:hypothetical protein
MRQTTEWLLAQFPDLHMKIEAIVAEGNLMAVRVLAERTNLGPFDGIGQPRAALHLRDLVLRRSRCHLDLPELSDLRRRTFEDVGIEPKLTLLVSFLLVCVAEVVGVLLWRRKRSGCLLALALLPIEFAATDSAAPTSSGLASRPGPRFGPGCGRASD